jgi:hypothetical protein
MCDDDVDTFFNVEVVASGRRILEGAVCVG